MSVYGNFSIYPNTGTYNAPVGLGVAVETLPASIEISLLRVYSRGNTESDTYLKGAIYKDGSLTPEVTVTTPAIIPKYDWFSWRYIYFPSNTILDAGHSYVVAVVANNSFIIRYETTTSYTVRSLVPYSTLIAPSSFTSTLVSSLCFEYTSVTGPTNITSVNGVTSSNIGSINTVDWVDVASINSVGS